jgi:hypothetical protein
MTQAEVKAMIPMMVTTLWAAEALESSEVEADPIGLRLIGKF